MYYKYLRLHTLFGIGVAFLFALGGVVQPAAAQSEEVSDQDKAVHYSLYYEDFKNQNFESALPNLLWVIENAPTYPRGNDVNFERLVETYAGLATTAADDATARAYLDSALAVFDTAVPTVKEAGGEIDELVWTINKGRFIQTHGAKLADVIDQVPQIYLAAFEMAPEKVDPYYVRVIIDSYVRQDEKQKAVELMDRAESLHGDNADLMGYITEVRNSLFRTPEERMAFLETRLEKEPGNVEIMSELFNIYRQLQHRDKAAALGQQLANAEPSARVYQLLAKMKLDDGEAQEAMSLYEQALALAEEPKQKRDIYYNMGIAQQQLGRLANARTSFRNALEIDNKFGPAYLAIGDLYVTAVSNCGSFEREDRAVYWLAADYYERARSADPTVANAAQQKLGTYRRSFPDQEALFFKGWKPGQSYRIDYGCYSWIGETTSVRSP